MTTPAVDQDGEVQRTSLRFAWEAVDERLLRRLLVGVYEAHDRSQEAAQLRQRESDTLVRQAEAALGRPPRARHMPEMVDVLRDHWFPALTRDELRDLVWDIQLSLSGPDRSCEPRTKSESLDFLARRNNTETFLLNVRSAFVRAHKIEQPIVRTSRQNGGRRLDPVELIGLAAPDRRVPYDHQRAAWDALDILSGARKPERRSGLLVLPTGAGKTFTMTEWLLRRLESDPELRVLWIADQQELVEQAGRAFESEAQFRGPDFRRLLRVLHGGASPASTLGDPELAVACTTRQTLMGQGFDHGARARLKQFLQRPTVVVVDEAHHAVSRSYRTLLAEIERLAPRRLLVGLTATPWPSGQGMTRRLHELFPQRLAEVQVRDLVHSGVLARPVFHTVDTGERVSVDAMELKQMVGRDVPPSVLRRLDRSSRNATVVNTWLARREEWGKTLLFACDIEHADSLGRLFREEDVDVTVVHSRSEVERGGALAGFRAASGPSVLVSVGMLLEGVDVPDARTAFLTRPTTSRILMRQMVGRVLRGPAGGGEELAHVVDLRDRWDVDVDVLAPVELSGLDSTITRDEDNKDRPLPPVLDGASGEPLGEDVLRAIERAYGELLRAEPLPHAAALASTTMVGFYELGEMNVPVFEHVRETWAELIASLLAKRSTATRSPVELFGDLPVPRPSRGDVTAVVDFVRSHEVEPPLVEVRSTVSVRRVALELLDRAAGTERERIQWLRERYEGSLARSAFFSFQAFYEAVQQEVLGLSGVTGSGTDPESPLPGGSRRVRVALRRQSSRELTPLFAETVTRARAMLADAGEHGYVELLHRFLLPAVEWTRRPGAGTFAYWSPRISGRSRGKPVIRVNRALQAPRTQVSDALLQYLLWHELCHHLLPGRGHDAEFRRLESMWPDFVELDAELDTLDERFEVFPSPR